MRGVRHLRGCVAVYGLPKNVGAVEVHEILSAAAREGGGRIHSIKIGKRWLDTTAGVAGMYAQVRFSSEMAAKKVIELLDNTTMLGRTCRVQWYIPQSIGKTYQVVFDHVSALSDRKLFDDWGNKYGKVVSIARCTSGLVVANFVSSDGASTAAREMGGHETHFTLGPFAPFTPTRTDATICIKNFSALTSERDLVSHFEKFGPILKLQVIKDSNASSTHQALLEFQDPSSAIQAMNDMNNYMLGPKGATHALHVYPAHFHQDFSAVINSIVTQTHVSEFPNVFVKNLSSEVDKATLLQHFATTDIVPRSAVLVRKGHARQLGFGFVEFNTSKEAVRIVQEKNGSTLCGIKIYACISKRKSPVFDLVSQFSMALNDLLNSKPRPFRPAFPYMVPRLVYPVAPMAAPWPAPSVVTPFQYPAYDHPPILPPRLHHHRAEEQPQPLTTEADTKQLIGEAIFMEAEQLIPQEKVGKVTGILLESIELTRLSDLIDNKEALTVEILGAYHALQARDNADETDSNE
ncbi:Polyadenylate-binding protein 7 [Pelomyxa schiedti]|nr:Polyadenylate-binding protein 7 [Pelomyxa schiedti]